MTGSKYEVRFPSNRVEKEFHKALAKLPKPDQKRIYQALQNLADDPRPPGK